MRLLRPSSPSRLAVPAAAQQKLGYVDSERVLALMPEYRTAQQDVDRLAAQWQTEVDAVSQEAATLQADFAARELLYTAEERTRGLSDIAARRQAADALRRRYFGPEGELFREQQTRLRPVQERLLTAIETVATDGDYDFVFDRSGDFVFLYARSRNDVTDRVLDALGLTVGAGGRARPPRRRRPRAAKAASRCPTAPPRDGPTFLPTPSPMTLRLLGALALLLALPAAAQAQAAFKVAYIDTDQIVVRTPEYAQAQTRLQAEQQTVGTRVRFVQDSLNTALQTQLADYETFRTSALATPDARREREADMLQLQGPIEQTEQQGLQYLSYVEARLYQPILDRVDGAIRAEAAAQTIDLVDPEHGQQRAVVLYASDRLVDITEPVMRRLGIDPAAPVPGQQPGAAGAPRPAAPRAPGN